MVFSNLVMKKVRIYEILQHTVAHYNEVTYSNITHIHLALQLVVVSVFTV